MLKGEFGGIICVAFVAAILIENDETIISTIKSLPKWLEIDEEVSVVNYKPGFHMPRLMLGILAVEFC